MRIHPEALTTLERWAETTREDYPDLTVWVEDGVVWANAPGSSDDIGLFSAVASGPRVVWCIRDGYTMVHRPHTERGSP